MITCKTCGANYNENLYQECPNSINHEGLGGVNYQAMKKDELIEACKEKGIELSGNESKAELIDLLGN